MNNIPRHVAIIMDGNGRWASERGFKRSEGHKEGAKVLEKAGAINEAELAAAAKDGMPNIPGMDLFK